MQFIYSEQVCVLVMRIFPSVSLISGCRRNVWSWTFFERWRSAQIVFLDTVIKALFKLQTASKLVYSITYPENETATSRKKFVGLSNLRARSQRKLRNCASQVLNVRRSACLPSRKNPRIPDRILHDVRNCEILTKHRETFQNIF